MKHQRRACCFPPWSKREGTGLEQVPRASSVPGLRGQGRPSGWMSPALGGTGVHALVTWWLRALGLGSRCHWEPAPGLLSPRGPLGTARAEGGVQREGSQHMAAALPACSQPADRRSSPCRNFFARSANLCAAGWVCAFSLFFFFPPLQPLQQRHLFSPRTPGIYTESSPSARRKKGRQRKLAPSAVCGSLSALCHAAAQSAAPATHQTPGTQSAPSEGQTPASCPRYGTLGCSPAPPRAQPRPLCSGEGNLAGKALLCASSPPRLSAGGGPPMRGFHHPALTAFNMLMTLCRAGAALCKTHVQPSVMDICSETRC